MKLYYDKRCKDPIYYVQRSARHGRKTPAGNIKRTGKHSGLLEITDNPSEYTETVIRKMYEEYRVGMAGFTQTVSFNDEADGTDAALSPYAAADTGYMFLQYSRTQTPSEQIFTAEKWLKY